MRRWDIGKSRRGILSHVSGPLAKAQVVGIPDKLSGEVPVAVFQPQKGNDLPAKGDIRDILVRELGPASVLERMYTLAELGLQDCPRTSSGKVRKIDLKDLLVTHEATVDDQIEESIDGTGPHDVENNVARLWARVFGIDAKTMDPNCHVDEFADSLMMLRLRSHVKKEFGSDVSIEELQRAGTVEKQAELLQSRQETAAGVVATREGPPGVDDMVV